MTPPIRLLAIDIDGTLLDSSFQISAANLEALQRAHASDVEIVLVTGRRHTFAMPIAERLGFDVWLITSNGAITKSSSGELFHRDLLPKQTALDLIRHMEPFRKNCVVTFDREDKGALVLEEIGELTHSIARWLEKNAAYVDYVIPLEKALTTDPVQAMFCGRIERIREAEEHLRRGGLDGRITALKTQYEARDLCILDVLNQGCSKGHAVQRWAEHRGYRREQIMAVGDNFNDVEMLEIAGHPFIMENACDELKQSRWRVTRSNDHSGVAHALELVMGW